jgi:hypothetical protein
LFVYIIFRLFVSLDGGPDGPPYGAFLRTI